MKDTIIDLDLIFVSPEWKIESIFATIPMSSLDKLISSGDVIAAIEVCAGGAMQLGLRVDDFVMVADYPT